MADCLINLLKELGKCIWPPLKPHFDYWWCFDGNVQGLRDEIRCLEMERGNMDQKIEEARLRAEIATPDVNNWSNEGTQKLEEAARNLQGCDDLKVWNIKSRYLVGKRAKEIAEGIAKLRNDGNSIRIADTAPPASMVPNSPASTLEFQSRKSKEEDILKYLKDGNVHMIAICGAGGVGKTTMVQRIEDRVRQEFDEVVTVVVSQQTDNLKIQKKIAEILRLDLGEETLEGRAHKLRTRLMDSKKKLIIFDDFWKSFKLKDIGVPYGGCKIILTSRLKDVCQKMDADKVIEIQALDKKVLWIENLPILNSFVEIEDSEHTHDHHSLHFFCNKKVEIIGLKTLYLQDLPDKISNIWCRHIPLSFFHNLKRLSIDKVDGIKNLISSSIAKALVNLKKLDISSCIDAIEDETHITVTFVLPKLENLYIKGNCKLRSFCQWKHDFELPSLEDVEIVNCPLMKTFTLGLLSTPKLHRFSINYKKIEMKDLNVGIHHFISTETANEDEDEDENEIEG